MLSATDGGGDDDDEAAAVDFDSLGIGLVAFAIAIVLPLDCYWQRPSWLPLHAVQRPLCIIEETQLNRLMIFLLLISILYVCVWMYACFVCGINRLLNIFFLKLKILIGSHVVQCWYSASAYNILLMIWTFMDFVQ